MISWRFPIFCMRLSGMVAVRQCQQQYPKDADLGRPISINCTTKTRMATYGVFGMYFPQYDTKPR
jgi:hypothetical protein